jgi:hypothetical protein
LVLLASSDNHFGALAAASVFPHSAIVILLLN